MSSYSREMLNNDPLFYKICLKKLSTAMNADMDKYIKHFDGPRVDYWWILHTLEKQNYKCASCKNILTLSSYERHDPSASQNYIKTNKIRYFQNLSQVINPSIREVTHSLFNDCKQ